MRWIFITHDESQMMDIKCYCKPIKWNCSEVMCIYASQRSESDGTETHAHSMSISTQEPEAAGCPQHWGDMRWRNLSTCRSAICTITIYIYLSISIIIYIYIYIYLFLVCTKSVLVCLTSSGSGKAVHRWLAPCCQVKEGLAAVQAAMDCDPNIQKRHAIHGFATKYDTKMGS